MGKYKQKNSEIDTFHAAEPKIMTTLPAGMYMFKVNNRNTTSRCKISSNLTIRTSERLH